MTNNDDSNNLSDSSLVSSKFKVLREMLSLNYKEISDVLDVSEKEIERYESSKFSNTPADNKKYFVEIYEPEKSFESRGLNLLSFDRIDLLLEELKSTDNYVVEFSGRIKPGQVLYDELERINYEDYNILEITNIKKVKNHSW